MLPRHRLPRRIGAREIAALAILALPIAMAEPAAAQPSPEQIDAIRQACRSDFISALLRRAAGGPRGAGVPRAQCRATVGGLRQRSRRGHAQGGNQAGDEAGNHASNPAAGRRSRGAVRAGSACRRPAGLHGQRLHVPLLVDCARATPSSYCACGPMRASFRRPAKTSCVQPRPPPRRRPQQHRP